MDSLSSRVKLTILIIHGNPIYMEMESSDTIQKVKAKIQEKEGIPPDEQMLFRFKTYLLDSRTLAYYGTYALDVFKLVRVSVGGVQVLTGKTITSEGARTLADYYIKKRLGARKLTTELNENLFDLKPEEEEAPADLVVPSYQFKEIEARTW